jgi:predicted DCC family thiol-disulfide oxidoreductase YuxK
MGNDNIQNRKIIFFDGVCHLCNAFVDTVVAQDKAHIFQFAPLQGETAKALLNDQDRNSLDTVIYFESGTVSRKSTAVLRILSQLGGVYKLASLGWIVPSFLRDAVYGFVAKNRYAWFGKSDTCRIPTAEERAYLLR